MNRMGYINGKVMFAGQHSGRADVEDFQSDVH
jgi:hypothetical protein